MLSLVLSCAQTTLSAPPNDPTSTAIRLEPVAQGFAQVTDIQFPPGSSTEMVVLQKPGTAWVQPLGSGERRKLFALDVATASEMGLLGLAFHPKFPADARVFVNYVVKGPVSRIAELTLDPAAWTMKSERILLTVEQPYVNHKAGQVAFGPDGFLYIGWGDGGSGGDPHGHGQDLTTMLGSMLRIDVDRRDGNRAYGIPADNPFLGQKDVPPETWAYGLRNPWRFSFDPKGRMVVADVGQNKYEEIDLVAAGDNLGWNIREGKHCYQPPTGCRTEGLVDPIFEYGRDEGISVTGGYVATATDVPAIANKYVFGDFGSGNIWALTLPEARSDAEATLLGQWEVQISTFGRDGQGRVYVGDFGSGTIYRIASP